jgi:hypothetical protein
MIVRASTNKESRFIMAFLLIICFFFTFAKISTPYFDIFYYYFIVILLLPIFYLKYKTFSSGILLVFSYLLAVGVFNVFVGNNTADQFVKVWGSTFAMYVFYFLVIKFYHYDLKKIFSIYVKGAFWVCVLGLFQIFSFEFGLEWGYNYSWVGLEGVRYYAGTTDGLFGLYPIHSIYGEPAHFGCGIAPAAFVALNNIFKGQNYFISKYQSAIILIAMIFSTASSAYFALFIGIIVLLFSTSNFISFALISISAPYFFYYLYYNNIKFQSRLDAVLALLQDESSLKVALMASTGSVRILFNNTIIAFRNFSDHFFFGTGLGSHATAYFKYSVIPYWHEDYGLNYNDANSLFNRLLSETGFIGMAFIVYFLIKFRVKSSQNIEYWLINKGSLLIILTYLLRQGHYFTYAFPLFVLFYYFTGKHTNASN